MEEVKSGVVGWDGIGWVHNRSRHVRTSEELKKKAFYREEKRQLEACNTVVVDDKLR